MQNAATPVYRLNDLIKVTPEKFVFGGSALARLNDRVVFVWGALPGEEVMARIVKKHKGVIEAITERVVKKSDFRIEPPEKHWLCCSPWSILDSADEPAQKTALITETFTRIGKSVELPDLKFVDSENYAGYRNKMEFSFTADENGEPSIGFFNRGTYRLTPINDCALASARINETVKIIVAWVKEAKLTVRNLKSVIIRSNSEGDVIAGLFIKDEVPLIALPALPAWWRGFTIFYSTFRSPASTPDKVLASEGELRLSETINDIKFNFGLFSFFQVNVPVFKKALQDIKKHIPKNAELLDYYSGVGTIGLALAKNVKHVTLVESNTEAGEYALKNIASNEIKNVTNVIAPAEHTLDYITPTATLIVDPPRAGLDKRVVEKILAVKPPQVIYLSCGPDTQARDLGFLSSNYSITFASLYNFFPRTPHCESLVVLSLKA